ncbi:uracil-DNA glycosylase [Holzapfeliella floricola]|uniref:Uracil-DNA glycosylase n=1 Tax=Holzapfeliella floricola DSM 23037 = JCM 16512 TaxID=1423744 RepID=A0A0R2DNZ0_9LACO|nr:uracil-DNA glycosylase [Holzapfeliella floricola]KRN03509.1 uracil-DNA glycosylase [Holzapfeliella floricola DSM 23037 = JCM 16512]
MKQLIGNDWDQVLKSSFESESYQELRGFLKSEYSQQVIYPEMHHIYEAFKLTPFNKTKVVILGQDPYHNPNQAHGLSFSVLPGSKLPPSLKNIYKELKEDLGIEPVNHGYLKSWADQGVLMLNTVLTVQYHQPNSHAGKGWEQLTDAAIKALSNRGDVVFILWGAYAQKKSKLIDSTKNVMIKSPHPSPLSAYRGFFGSKPFSQINVALEQFGEAPINWQLPETP